MGAIAVFNVEGRLYATADRCTHGDASLCDGMVFDNVVECPFHGGTFDVVTGQALTYPVTEPLRTFPVEVSDGMAFLIVQSEPS